MIDSTGRHCTARRRMTLRRTALLVLAGAAAACDELPTMPSTDDAPDVQMALVINEGAGAAVEDALTRLVPSLVDAAAADPLRVTLTNLQKLLVDHNGDGIAEATKAALNMIAVYERRTGYNGSEAADLDAIRLALQ
jgi:hypothetical protein